MSISIFEYLAHVLVPRVVVKKFVCPKIIMFILLLFPKWTAWRRLSVNTNNTYTWTFQKLAINVHPVITISQYCILSSLFMNVIYKHLHSTTIFVSTTLIAGYHSLRRMYNRGSCKACGTHLTPSAICNICKEYVSWICGKCYKMDDVTHSHNYCRVSYKPEKIVIK